MKLNKPVITILIIIMLVVDLIFFSFLSIGKKVTEKEELEEISQKFDFKKYLLNNEKIKHSIKNYKYNEEVFNYMDELKIKILKKNAVDNIVNKKNLIFDKNEVKEILRESVYEYEIKESKDIYEYVSEDIEYFSNYLETSFDKEYIDVFEFIRNFSNSILYSICLIAALLFIALVIVFEKKNGLLLGAITLFIYSFFVYYLNFNILTFAFHNLTNYIDSINLHLEYLYVICFILGFVLLLIYIVLFLKKFARKTRLKSYGSWR